MSSRYGNIIGKMELKVGGFDKELTPKVGDGRKFMKLISKAEENKDLLFDNFAGFMCELIARDHPPKDDAEKEQLEMYVDMNLLPLLNEIMVNFGLTTREALEKSKKDMLQGINARVKN